MRILTVSFGGCSCRSFADCRDFPVVAVLAVFFAVFFAACPILARFAFPARFRPGTDVFAMLFAPAAQSLQDGPEGQAVFGKPVFHRYGCSIVDGSNDKSIQFQLF